MVKILIDCFFYTFYIDKDVLGEYLIYDKFLKKYRSLIPSDFKVKNLKDR